MELVTVIRFIWCFQHVSLYLRCPNGQLDGKPCLQQEGGLRDGYI